MGLPIRYNLRNLVERKGSTMMTALGIGLTVAVLVTSIAMSAGMAAVFAGSGHPLQVLVLRKGTDAELSSSMREESFQIRTGIDFQKEISTRYCACSSTECHFSFFFCNFFHNDLLYSEINSKET